MNTKTIPPMSGDTQPGNLAFLQDAMLTNRMRLPQQMINAKRWLLWAEVPNPEPTKKPKKVPYYVNGKERGKGYGTDCPEDLAQLATYDQALDALTFGDREYAGVGFALGPDDTGDYWQGFDADRLTPAEVDAAIVNHDDAGYMEVSPSGRGFHVIGYGRHFKSLGNNGTGVEAYAQGRFFTFTGERGRGKPTCIAAWVEGPVAERHRKTTSHASADGIVQVDAKTIAHLRSAMFSVRADDYEIWKTFGMALKCLGDIGRGLWMEWSATSEKFNSQEAARKWDRDFANVHSLSYTTVFHEAQLRGWPNPMSNAAQITPQVGSPSEKTGWQLLNELSVDWDATPDMESDVVDGLIADEEVTLLGGHGGGGKGFLALQFGVALALGESVLGRKAPKQYRVLHYSAEDGKKRLSRRLRAYLKNFTPEQVATVKKNLKLIDASDLALLYGEQSIDGRSFAKALQATPDYYNLQKMAEAFDADVVVVDGASDTFGGNEISRLQTTEFVKLLKRLHPKRRVAVLLLVHIDRSSARGNVTDDDGYSGNSAWHNACRRRMYLQKKVEKDTATREVISEDVSLRVMKNQDGVPMPDVELMRDENGFWVRPGDFVAAPLVEQAAGVVAQAKPDAAKVILDLIDRYYQRAKWMSTSLAANATKGIFAMLEGDPEFVALKLNKKKTKLIVQQLERDDLLEPEGYKDEYRKDAVRWKVVKAPKYPAPGEQVE